MGAAAKSPLAKNLFLLVIVAALIFAPLFVLRDARFGGADDQVGEVVAEMQSGYEPWFKPVWEPPSGEIETFLFALQAAAGSGIVCYYLGYLRGRKKGEGDRLKNVQH